MATVNDIFNEITRIDNAKQGIADAIEEKGVQVPENSKIEEYPGFVRQIQQGAVLQDFRLLETIDCSTLDVGGSIEVNDADGLTEIVFVWERMIGATPTASQFRLTAYNSLDELIYIDVIRYSASNNANGLSGITRMWYDGFLWFYHTSGANSPENYALISPLMPYNVNKNTFGQGKIKHLVLDSNPIYPIASGIVRIYGR